VKIQVFAIAVKITPIIGLILYFFPAAEQSIASCNIFIGANRLLNIAYAQKYKRSLALNYLSCLLKTKSNARQAF
jgi:hypothetical protein